VADEFGFWNHPRVLKSVLRPQLLTTRGQLIIASTPAEDLSHPYYTDCEKAKRKNRFIQRTIFHNGSLTQDEIAQEMEEQGGSDSPTWRREYLCEHIGDPTLRIVPEWSDEKNIVPDTYPRPAHFDAYVGGDSGVDDNTALLFGYYDFVNDEVVIEQEFVTSGKPTKEIIESAKVIEKDIWEEKKPYRRVYDADKQVLVDVISTHGYSVYLPDKADKTSAINRFRVRVGAGKFKVKQRCVNLIRQLKVGQWKDERHSDFARSEELKHLDAIAAAVYFNRSIITTRNPYPQLEGVSLVDHFMSETVLKSQAQTEDDALADALFSNPLRSLNG
jgi:virulence-associated protein VapD